MNIPQIVGRAIRPPERITVSEWADEHRVLPSTTAEPGRWRTDRTPYMREIMDCLTPGSGVREIVVMKSAQVGGTELILNSIGHMMTVDPGPGLVVQPTETTSLDWSRERLTPMIASTPQLHDLFGDNQRNPNNRTSFKKFPGGTLSIAYASSAVQLRSKPIRYVWCDEVDGYPANLDGEGDPVELAIARTRTFSDRKRIVGVSTPTIKGRSRIERWFGTGDQRRYHLPCPHCDAQFVPRLDYLERTPEGAMLECPECRVLIDEAAKGDMLARGEWIADNPDADPRVRSYHLSALVAPAGWYSWTDVLDDYDKAVASDDPDAMRVYVNTVLGESYEETESEAADWEKIYNRRGGCTAGVVPIDACILTAGVDVQGDRLECEVVAWGEGLRSWSVDYIVLPGDPSQRDVWVDLTRVLRTRWQGERGATYEISRLAIDTGYMTNHVYQWAREHGNAAVMAIKGSTRTATLIGKPKPQDVDAGGRTIRNGVWLWPLNVDAMKSHVMRWIMLEVAVPDEHGELVTPERWCEWPAYAPEYFRGLCGEQQTRRGNRLVWEKIYRDNEPLDCRVYATAAAHSLGLDRWTEDKWQAARRDVLAASRHDDEVAPAIRRPTSSPRANKKQKRPRYSDSNFLKR